MYLVGCIRYFDPAYQRENEVLSSFKASNPELTDEQTLFLKDLLISLFTSWPDKYFVADLLHLYQCFSKDLFDPLLNISIYYKDPSFNSIFLQPCIQTFGKRAVIRKLSNKFDTGSISERIGIASLLYWLIGFQKDTSVIHIRLAPLYKKILHKALETNNIVELYYYKLYLPKDENSYDLEVETIVPLVFNKFKQVPDGADALAKTIQGHKELEDILYNQLGWEQD